MAYASSADFIAAFGEAEWLQLTDRDLDDVSDTGVGDAALIAASDTVDRYASAIYAVPLSPVDAVVKSITLALARWDLSGNAASERTTEGYKEANKRLSDIAAKRLLLSAAKISTASSDGTTGSSGGMAYSTPSDGFTAAPGITSYL